MIKKIIHFKNRPLIWPLPNHINWNDGYLHLKGRETLFADKCFSMEVKLFISQLEAINLTVSTQENRGTIQLHKTNDDKIKDEGYTLEVTVENIILTAKTSRGIFYGLQSLIQLISNSHDMEIPCVSIIDSPFKPVRGVHIYMPAKQNIDWFKRYVDFLVKYKYNTMFLEIGGSMRFDSHPEINAEWVKFCKKVSELPEGQEKGIQKAQGHPKNSVHFEIGGGGYWEKEELSELVEYIKERHIEIIPEVQGLSHSYWMLMTHMECAERDDDPYPDTWCPSNPRTYEIYFDCLQEILDLFNPKMIHIGHDEYYSIGLCEKCRDISGHDILAGDIIKIHDWLAEHGVKAAIWGDKLFRYRSIDGRNEFGGIERLHYNWKKRKNEIMKSTYRAVDIVPDDITVIDWYHSLPDEETEDTKSQDYFMHRRMNVIFGNFNGDTESPSFKNLEDRLRRPNVLGAECSCWRNVGDPGMAMNDQLVLYLDVSNVLWFKGYRNTMRNEFNNIIAQVYPLERDKLSNTQSAVLPNRGFRSIDISDHYNMSLNSVEDYSFVLNTGKLPDSVPFEVLKNVKNIENDAAIILVGHGKDDKLENIKIEEKYHALVFLHAYTVKNPVAHPNNEWDYDPAKDTVGYYTIKYADGTCEKVSLEYGMKITDVNNTFNAYYANPQYQKTVIKQKTQKGIVSKKIVYDISSLVIFSYEWKNPYPEKEIKSFSIEHEKNIKGGIILFAITGIK